jgi:hypothetical protein
MRLCEDDGCGTVCTYRCMVDNRIMTSSVCANKLPLLVGLLGGVPN